MIGLDSNVLLRYFAQDDAVQSPKATEVIQSLTEDEPGHLTHVVLVETARVLARSYKVPERMIVVIISHLLGSRSFTVSDEADVALALRAASAGEATFAVALIGALSVRFGAARS